MGSGYWLSLTKVAAGKRLQKIGEKHVFPLCLLAVTIGLLIVWLVPLATLSAVGFFLTDFSSTFSKISNFINGGVPKGTWRFVQFGKSLGGVSESFLVAMSKRQHALLHKVSERRYKGS
jgi:hypothetical protein